MRKKHYIAIAKAINEARQSLSYASVCMPETKRTLEMVVDNIARVMQEDNARFDRDKFEVACGVGQDVVCTSHRYSEECEQVTKC